MSNYDWVAWAQRESESLAAEKHTPAHEESRMYNYLRGWLAGQKGDVSGLSDMAGRIAIKEQAQSGWYPR